jgi:CelD/BcsL family acetyltransferase involved in cellulose biosynthesis
LPIALPDTSAQAATGELVLEPIADLAVVEADWRRLAERAGNPFTTWAWASSWLRFVHPDGQVAAWRCLDAAGHTTGIIPLHLSRTRGLRVLRFIGNGPADELAPLSAPHDRPAVARAFGRALSHGGSWDLCLAERLPAAEGWTESLGGRTLRRELSPELELTTSDWDDFLAGRSSNFRQQVRKFERRLVRDHGLRYRLVEDVATLEADMESLFRLHDARWGEATTAFTERLRPFHLEVAAAGLKEGWLRMWFAELEGRPAAVWYGFRMGGADWFYQQGRDPAWERSSVGFVLTAHTLRDAVQAGMTRYRFLLGAEEYKARFSTREPEVETVARARSRRGAMALPAYRGLRRLRAAFRRFAARGL